MFKICFEFKNAQDVFTFSLSLFAALFPTELPSKRTKCCLRQSNFSNFSGERILTDPSASSRLRRSLISLHDGIRKSPQEILFTGLKIDGNSGNVSAGVLISKVAYQCKR